MEILIEKTYQTHKSDNKKNRRIFTFIFHNQSYLIFVLNTINFPNMIEF